MDRQVTIMEVSPRDGLQNEATLLSTEDKLELIDRSLASGARRIEVTSFVHPKLVPQMADAEAVAKGLPQRGDVTYTGLVLNRRGYDRLLATERLNEAGIVIPASNTLRLAKLIITQPLLLVPSRSGSHSKLAAFRICHSCLSAGL